MALEEGTTAAEIMLLPYSNEPLTGSRMPSMSTGGAAIKAMVKQMVAASKQGIISTPNQPMYKRLSVLVIHWQNCSHTLALSRLCTVVVIFLIDRVKNLQIRVLVLIYSMYHFVTNCQFYFETNSIYS
jgi:hypothetical protein